MNLRKLILPVLSLILVVLSCKKDDEDVFQAIPDRDRQEVYDENLIEIEEYLATHFFNYEDFDEANPYSEANDAFTIVFDTIAGVNSDKTPLIDQVTFKPVTQDGIDYKLYYLVVREGLGKPVHSLDKAAVLYRGTVLDGTFFDGAVNIDENQPFNLTGVGSIGGVVAGFREGIVEFNTATSITQNPDGTTTFDDHGIGAVFMPSGLGYFARPTSSAIPAYSPLIFTLKVISRTNTDWDVDGIPSHIEHPDGDITGVEDNTDGDLLVNFIDNDDDGDGVLTRDEVQQKEYEDDGVSPFMTKAEAVAYYDNTIATNGENELFVKTELKLDNTFTLHTVVVPQTDVNGEMLPNYLNPNITEVLE
ncbi:FKBP-type peptidyl-prolyl cis-trans isomerase [Lacinutrix sp. Hel_I_90]|uniref:FKBP-type peptidyl-prolyl cis-trans isomerase n=1 Tax=Lacinutrix sp. Hel_I_90 TaxID=1249999 RepID=UPI0006986012|nr:FKBP-type peptidyl-prolyl cis-trans isomerase [Lacinutrix sp. Hel_I_90]